MSELRRLPLPDGGMLAWQDPVWVRSILPADSRKKRLIRALARLRVLDLLCHRFDGRLVFDGQPLRLDDVLDRLSGPTMAARPAAIFANARRDPPRIYVWLQSGDKSLFLKIGTERDAPAFRNEIQIGAKLEVPPDFLVMRPIELFRFDGLAILLSDGIAPKILEGMERMNSREAFARFTAQGLGREGLFGGPVHGDLASNNMFKYERRILLVDWEFAALSGPDYCDLVGLAAALAAENANTGGSVEATRAFLAHEAGCDLCEGAVAECLEFLAARGNRQAVQALEGSARVKEYLDGQVT